jgi:uncharacterized protein YbjT (DUF2867 family)
MIRLFKFLLKAILSIVVIIIVLIGSAIISMRANVPDEFYQPVPLTQPQTASSDKSYLVFGGRKGTGLEVIKVLRARGERVTAMIRPSSMTPEKTSDLQALGVDLIAGDATNVDDVTDVFASGDYIAVVSTVGCFSCEPPADFIGNKIITDGAQRAGVSRIVQVSSIGAGNSADSAPWLSRTALSKMLPLKTQAEDYLKASGLDYTIIRPGGLKNGTANGFGYLSEDMEAFGFIDRADLARLIVGAMDDDAGDETRIWIFQ